MASLFDSKLLFYLVALEYQLSPVKRRGMGLSLSVRLSVYLSVLTIVFDVVSLGEFDMKVLFFSFKIAITYYPRSEVVTRFHRLTIVDFIALLEKNNNFRFSWENVVDRKGYYHFNNDTTHIEGIDLYLIYIITTYWNFPSSRFHVDW